MFSQNLNDEQEDPMKDTSLQAAISFFMSTMPQKSQKIEISSKEEDLSPVQDLVNKVESQRTLTANDLKIISDTLNHAYQFTAETQQKEFIKLSIYALAQSCTTGVNSIEHESMQQLAVQLIEISKTIIKEQKWAFVGLACTMLQFCNGENVNGKKIKIDVKSIQCLNLHIKNLIKDQLLKVDDPQPQNFDQVLNYVSQEYQVLTQVILNKQQISSATKQAGKKKLNLAVQELNEIFKSQFSTKLKEAMNNDTFNVLNHVANQLPQILKILDQLEPQSNIKKEIVQIILEVAVRAHLNLSGSDNRLLLARCIMCLNYLDDAQSLTEIFQSLKISQLSLSQQAKKNMVQATLILAESMSKAILKLCEIGQTQKYLQASAEVTLLVVRSSQVKIEESKQQVMQIKTRSQSKKTNDSSTVRQFIKAKRQVHNIEMDQDDESFPDVGQIYPELIFQSCMGSLVIAMDRFTSKYGSQSNPISDQNLSLQTLSTLFELCQCSPQAASPIIAGVVNRLSAGFLFHQNNFILDYLFSIERKIFQKSVILSQFFVRMILKQKQIGSHRQFDCCRDDFNNTVIFLAALMTNPEQVRTSNIFLLHLQYLQFDYTKIIIKFLTNDASADIDLQQSTRTSLLKPNSPIQPDQILNQLIEQIYKDKITGQGEFSGPLQSNQQVNALCDVLSKLNYQQSKVELLAAQQEVIRFLDDEPLVQTFLVKVFNLDDENLAVQFKKSDAFRPYLQPSIFQKTFKHQHNHFYSHFFVFDEIKPDSQYDIQMWKALQDLYLAQKTGQPVERNKTQDILQAIEAGLKCIGKREFVQGTLSQICQLIQKQDIDKVTQNLSGLVKLCFEWSLIDQSKPSNSINFKVLNSLASRVNEVADQIEQLGEYTVGNFVCRVALMDDGLLIKQIKYFFKQMNRVDFVHKVLTASIGISLSTQTPELNFVMNLLELAQILGSELTISIIKQDLFQISNQQQKVILIDVLCQLAQSLVDPEFEPEILSQKRERNAKVKKVDKTSAIKKHKMISGYKEQVYKQENRQDYMSEPSDQCTYLRTGPSHEMQFWYFCYTCNIVGNTGVCSVCVSTCHAGHHVAFSKKSSFYCDCMDSGKCCFGSKQKSVPKPDRFIQQLSREKEFLSHILQRDQGLRSMFQRDLALEQQEGAIRLMSTGSVPFGINRLLGSNPVSGFGDVNMDSVSEDESVFDEQQQQMIQLEMLEAGHSMREIHEFIERTKKNLQRQEKSQSNSNENSSEPQKMQVDDESSFISDNFDDTVSLQSFKTYSKIKTYDNNKFDVSGVLDSDAQQFISDSITSLLQNQQSKSKQQQKSENLTLNQDPNVVQNKKNIREGSFKVDMPRVQNKNCVSASSRGITVILEGENVIIFSSASFIDGQVNRQLQPKTDAHPFGCLENYKLNFAPTSAQFNRHCSHILAVWNGKDLAALSITQRPNFKVKSEVRVNLMLDAFGDHLNIINTDWLNETTLAIATQSFIRIYDLSKDNFSPLYNVQPYEGQITNFTTVDSRLVVACDSRLLVHDLGNLKNGMEIDSEIVLVEELKYENPNAITTVQYMQSYQLLFVGFESGNHVIGRIEQQTLNVVFKIPSDIKDLGKVRQLRDFKNSPDSVSFTTISNLRDQLSTVHCVIQDNKITLASLKNKRNVCGLTVLNDKACKNNVVVVFEDGSCQVVQFGSTESFKAKSQFKINKQDLPNQVTLPSQFFEKTQGLQEAGEQVRQSFQISGSITSLIKSVELQKRLWDDTNYGPVVEDHNSRSLKMNLRLKDNNGALIVGIRIKMAAKQGNKVRVKVLNRQNLQIVQSDLPMWYDVAMCDAESIYAVQNNGIDVEFLTDDPKQCPLVIHKCEVYVQTNQAFNLAQKLQKQLKSMLLQQGGDQQRDFIREQLLQTSNLPLVTWKEKSKYTKNNQICLLLDVVYRLLLSNTKIINVQQLREMLQTRECDSEYEQAAVKRVLRIICEHQGDYYQIKDNQLHQLDLSKQLAKLSKIYFKRMGNLFRILQQDPELVTKLALRLVGMNHNSKQQMKDDVYHLLTLIFAVFTYQINQTSKVSTNLQLQFQHILQQADVKLVAGFQILLESDLAKVIMTVLAKAIAPYKNAMQESLQSGQLIQMEGNQVMIIDPSFHIIRVSLACQQLIGFKIAQALINWGKPTDFYKQQFIQDQVARLGKENQQSEVVAYANLVNLNMFLQGYDVEGSPQAQNWAQNILEKISTQFLAGRGSLRNVVNDGVRTGTKEVYDSNDQVLLKVPVNVETSWQWSPLFPDDERAFELLDRKTSIQVLLICQKIFKQQCSDKLLRAIAQISFSLPMCEFLSDIGFQTLTILAPSRAAELRDQVLLKEFLQDLQTCTANILQSNQTPQYKTLLTLLELLKKNQKQLSPQENPQYLDLTFRLDLAQIQVLLLELVANVPDGRLSRFIDFFLLNPDKEVRKAAVKVLQRQHNKAQVSQVLLSKFQLIRSVYCEEFVMLLAELSDDPNLTSLIVQEISQCYTSITAHPNLDLYFIATKFFNTEKIDRNPFAQETVQENPYIFELEPCVKCYESRKQTFNNVRLTEFKTECKFTDTYAIFKLRQCIQIKQITANLKEFKGYKAVKKITVYCNNNQTLDLNEMKGNWQLWQKVTEIKVDVSQGTVFTANLPLTVTAHNILIEFDVANLTKPVEQLAKRKIEPQNNQDGLDAVLRKLPPQITQKLVTEQENQNVAGVNGILSCPKCGKQVKNPRGQCSCGENPMQCNRCRNINYDKPDPFLCKECGVSKYALFDFVLKCCEGNYVDPVESEDQKKILEEQVETNLQKAQSEYQNLLKTRTLVHQLCQSLNQNDDVSIKQLQQLIQQSQEAYNKMMSALSQIKAVKIRINQFKNVFHQTETQLVVQQKSDCFACVQEELNSLLKTFKTIKIQGHGKQQVLELLYTKCLTTHSKAIQRDARNAIACLVDDDQGLQEMILQQINFNLKNKPMTVPAHQLQANLSQETLLLIDVYRKNTQQYFWKTLFEAIDNAQCSSAVGEAVVLPLIWTINKKVLNDEEPIETIKNYLRTDSKWISQTLLLQSSIRVRQETLKMINHLLKDKDMEQFVLQMCVNSLDLCLSQTAQTSDQYFELFQKVLQHNISENYFRIIFSRTDTELDKLYSLEQVKATSGNSGFMPQLQAGQQLCKLVQILSQMLQGQQSLIRVVRDDVKIVIRAQLKLKKLSLVTNKAIKTCEEQMNDVFKQLHSDNDQDKTTFIRECFKLFSDDLTEARHLTENICKVILPTKIQLEYMLRLQKAPSNEEYIPGRMNKNPYSAKSFGGKTMGDVRLKICRDCEIDVEILELLVAGQIVCSNLEINQVYEQIWWPHSYRQKHPDSYEIPQIQDAVAQEPSLMTQMVVVFRLIGVDGEATEDRVESLSNNLEPTNEAEIEKKYYLAHTVGQVSGFAVLLNILSKVQNLQDNKELVTSILQLITISLKLKQNRQQISGTHKAIQTISRTLFQSVGVHSKFDGRNEMSMFDVILNILETIIESSNGLDQDAGSEESAAQVEMFIEIINDASKEQQVSNKIKAISKVLPYLVSKNDRQSVELLIAFVAQYLQIDKILHNSNQFFVATVINILEAIPPLKIFIKDRICQLPAIQNLIQYAKTMDQLAEPRVEISQNVQTTIVILKIIKSLIINHPQSQQLLKEMLSNIFILSVQNFQDMSCVLVAQDIIKAIQNEHADQAIKESVQEMIQKRKSEQQERAKKAQALAKLRMMKKETSSKFLDLAALVKEELGPKCVACQDGYGTKPTEILGLYVFQKRIDYKDQQNYIGFSSVTHNNFIHFTCHSTAAKEDRSKQQQVKEWDGAKIRNHHTLCNNLYPIKGGSITNDSFLSITDRFLNLANKTVGNNDGNRVRLLTQDLKSLLKRFAFQESFSRDSKGGGPESNMQIFPFMVQIIAHQLVYLPGNNLLADNQYLLQTKLKQFLAQNEEIKVAEVEEEEKSFGESLEDEESYDEQMSQEVPVKVSREQMSEVDETVDNLAYYMTLALFYIRQDDWHDQKLQLLSICLTKISQLRHIPGDQAGNFNICVEMSGRQRSRSFTDNDNLMVFLARIRPILVLLSLVNFVKTQWSFCHKADSIKDLLLKLSENLSKNNLKSIQDNSQQMYEQYLQLIKIDSVDGFVDQLDLRSDVIKRGGVEKFVISHFN